MLRIAGAAISVWTNERFSPVIPSISGRGWMLTYIAVCSLSHPPHPLFPVILLLLLCNECALRNLTLENTSPVISHLRARAHTHTHKTSRDCCHPRVCLLAHAYNMSVCFAHVFCGCTPQINIIHGFKSDYDCEAGCESVQRPQMNYLVCLRVNVYLKYINKSTEEKK